MARGLNLQIRHDARQLQLLLVLLVPLALPHLVHSALVRIVGGQRAVADEALGSLRA